jgi:hypothetical protein
MNILNDTTALAVISSLKNVGYSLADVTAAWNPTVAGPAASLSSTFILGVNPGNAPDVDSAIAAMKHFGMKIARFWTTGAFTSPPAQ